MRKNGAVRCTDEKEDLMKLLKKLCCPLLFSLFFVAALFFPVAFASADDTVDPVSYTHLTLPTILRE